MKGTVIRVLIKFLIKIDGFDSQVAVVELPSATKKIQHFCWKADSSKVEVAGFSAIYNVQNNQQTIWHFVQIIMHNRVLHDNTLLHLPEVKTCIGQSTFSPVFGSRGLEQVAKNY